MYKRVLAILALIAYCAFLVQVLVFKAVSFTLGHLMFNFSGHATGEANWVPFSTIIPYLLGEKGLVIVGFNVLGNIALFVPFGFLIVLVLRDMTWRRALLLAVLVPFAIEAVQAVFELGIFDIDDVILNGLGVMLGYGMHTLLERWSASRFSKTL